MLIFDKKNNEAHESPHSAFFLLALIANFYDLTDYDRNLLNGPLNEYMWPTVLVGDRLFRALIGRLVSGFEAIRLGNGLRRLWDDWMMLVRWLEAKETHLTEARIPSDH